jgi:hypothetical protein
VNDALVNTVLQVKKENKNIPFGQKAIIVQNFRCPADQHHNDSIESFCLLGEVSLR